MIRLAILWHQHQPCYLNLRSGEAVMPWVRLHGTKDYWGMAALLRRHPKVKAHVNLVPGLILQIEAAAAGALDPWLRLARIPAEDLRPEEKRAICETFFLAQEEHMIRANPRYGELLDKARGPGGWRPEALAAGDWLDLQVWQNLAWFHPLLREENDVVKSLVKKARGFSEGDKEKVLAAQREVLAGLVPAHRALQDSGQVEITTTPYWHPILPLLCNFESAKVAMPDVVLPRAPGLEMVEDARAHLRRAVALYRDRFGRDPRGLWPSEGSVSPAILPLLEEAGFRWLATDEGVLESSLRTDFRRDGAGTPADARSLYRPWKLSAGVSGVFRDHLMSDLVGFEYKRAQPEDAAADLVERIRRVGREAGHGALVTLALDGENAWEHFPGNGVPFLTAFYRHIESAADIRTVLLGDELETHPPDREIPKLWSGSWIHRNFSIWVGHPEDNLAWEHLGRARATLIAHGQDARHNPPPPALLPASRSGPAWAWESLFAAEGSDWFWWFGDEHHTALAGTFDALFRSHLQNVYHFIGHPAPPALLRPIKTKTPAGPSWTPPWALLSIKVDGRRSDYFEWISAGHYIAAKDCDIMDRSSAWIRDIWFGFDRDHLFLRVDAQGPAKEGLLTRCVMVQFVAPEGKRLSVTAGGVEGMAAKWAAGEVLEVSIPLKELGIAPGDLVEFFVEATCGPASQRVPARSPISIRSPRPDEDAVDWTV